MQPLDRARVVQRLKDGIASGASELSGAADDREAVAARALKPNIAGELYAASTPPDERGLALATDRGAESAGAREFADLVPATTKIARPAEQVAPGGAARAVIDKVAVGRHEPQAAHLTMIAV